MNAMRGESPRLGDVTPIRGARPPGQPGEPRAPFPRPVEDTEGHNYRPDPLLATASAELMSLLRQFRIWCGKPGVRVLSLRVDNRISPSAIHSALQSDRLPRLETLQLIIEALTRDEDDVRRWTTAWRKINLASE